MTDNEWEALGRRSEQMRLASRRLLVGERLHGHGTDWHGCVVCEPVHDYLMRAYHAIQGILGPVGGLQRRLAAAAASTTAAGVEEEDNG